MAVSCAVAFSECDYTPFYCEENVWKLCDKLNQNGVDMEELYVIFISNKDESVALFSQKAAKLRNFVVWDYHVILMHIQPHGAKIYDLDTTSGFPCSIVQYWRDTIKPEVNLPERFRRYFRVISASAFKTNFSSDRRHMRSERGEYVSPPPPWPAIFKEDLGHNLGNFISMDKRVNADISEVYNEQQFYEKFVASRE